MGILIVILLILAAAAGVLWEVLEFALWTALLLFVAVAAAVTYGYFKLKGRLGRSSRARS